MFYRLLNKIIMEIEHYRPYVEDCLIDHGLYTDRAVKTTLWLSNRFFFKIDQKIEHEIDNKKMLATSAPDEISRNEYYFGSSAFSLQFFELILGDWLKFGCCYFYDHWENCTDSTNIDSSIDLSTAEENMMDIYCDRAMLEDDMSVLLINAENGAFALYVAQQYPGSTITAVCTKNDQVNHINEKSKLLGIDNISCVQGDWQQLCMVYATGFSEKFDRVISIGALKFAHNWHDLTELLLSFLNRNGKFGQPFAFIEEATTSSIIEDKFGPSFSDRYFGNEGKFTHDFPNFVEGVSVDDSWVINGKHWQRTADLWLKNIDDSKKEVIQLLEKKLGIEEAIIAYNRWRVYFLVTSEKFGLEGGSRYVVSQYRIY
eukprot:NODE_184_length_13742_cov_0.550539.p4 type:complete len:372 gc:universal NODE_184_length_13742_cov_0.550539:5047-6162(+)